MLEPQRRTLQLYRLWTFCEAYPTLIVAATISILSIVGGVEVHPGAPRKELNSWLEEDIELAKVLIFEKLPNQISVHIPYRSQI